MKHCERLEFKILKLLFTTETRIWFNILEWEDATRIIFIIFWDLLTFYQISHSWQVKRCVIITYKHGIYEMLHELPIDLRLRILGYLEISGKCLNFIEWYTSVQSSCQFENFINPSKKTLKNRKLTFLVVRYFSWELECLKYFVTDSLWKPVSDPN